MKSLVVKNLADLISIRRRTSMLIERTSSRKEKNLLKREFKKINKSILALGGLL